MVMQNKFIDNKNCESAANVASRARYYKRRHSLTRNMSRCSEDDECCSICDVRTAKKLSTDQQIGSSELKSSRKVSLD